MTRREKEARKGIKRDEMLDRECQKEKETKRKMERLVSKKEEKNAKRARIERTFGNYESGG